MNLAGTKIQKKRWFHIMLRKLKNKKFIYVLLIISGMIGTVIFFPLKMNSGKTCLFHLYFSEDEGKYPYWDSTGTVNQWMLRRYLIPYAFIWWFSLGLLVLGISQIKHLKRNSASKQK